MDHCLLFGSKQIWTAKSRRAPTVWSGWKISETNPTVNVSYRRGKKLYVDDGDFETSRIFYVFWEGTKLLST
jgi:hypothetical protein